MGPETVLSRIVRLVEATPAAIMAGTGVAAQHGTLIKDVQALEAARRA